MNSPPHLDEGGDGVDPIESSFEVWWQQYPKRVAKGAALKAYRAVITKKLATAEELLTGAMRYAAERRGQDPRYTKHPSTWLNGGCWADKSAVSFAHTMADGSSSGFGPHFDQALADARLIAERSGQ